VVVNWQQTSNNSRLIAVVEDDAKLADLFRDILECDGRWRLHIFTNGQDAKDRLPALGASLIVITGSHDWELQRRGLQMGILLPNPFNVQELLFMISALLDA
jgi:DNA-binding response OmpR family regulator